MSVELFDQVVFAATELGLVDLMHGKASCGALLGCIDADSDMLPRLMRAMAHFGLCVDHGNQVFEMTEAGRRLKQFGIADVTAGEGHPQPDRQPGLSMLLYSVRTGQPAFERAFGTPFFNYIRMHPGAAHRFGNLMAADTLPRAAAIATTYDFSRYSTVVDVGGGHGALISEILKRHQHLSGVLIDVDTAIQHASARVRDWGLSARCQIVAGNFFEWVPPGGDLYLYSQILHDWADEECGAILDACYRAIPPDGKLLVIEALMPERIERPSPVAELDLMMMMLTGGRERTTGEYRGLLKRAGFEVASMIPVDADFTILEASPVAGFH